VSLVEVDGRTAIGILLDPRFVLVGIDDAIHQMATVWLYHRLVGFSHIQK
jgi:hypothetical protein